MMAVERAPVAAIAPLAALVARFRNRRMEIAATGAASSTISASRQSALAITTPAAIRVRLSG